MMNSFDECLAFGRIGERKIARWLIERGCYILPVYQIESDDKKGPRLFGKDKGLTVPDLLSIHKENGPVWIEAKHKTVFTWYRIRQSWQTGIDIYLYNQYLKVQDVSDWPVWLLFLHSQDRMEKRNEPWPCPTGLYGQAITILASRIDHDYRGMRYWNEKDLMKLAELLEL